MIFCFWLFQVQCGSVFVIFKDIVQKIKFIILVIYVKYKKFSKYVLVFGISFGYGKYGFFNLKVKFDLI